MYDFYIAMSYAATFVPLGALAVMSFLQWRKARHALAESETSNGPTA